MLNQKMTRREFMRLSIVSLSGAVLLTSCNGLVTSQKKIVLPRDYYTHKHEDILKDADHILEYLNKYTTSRYGSELTATMMKDTRDQFEKMLPDLPYIGGDDNDLTVNLYQASLALAFYRVMLAHGKTVDETGEALYHAMQALMAAEPLSGVMGWVSNSALAQGKLREDALDSQKRTYSADWVFEFVPGDDPDFDFGINYQECGICKYFSSQNAAELTPYMCLLDFPVSEAMHTGLMRTSTLAHGDKVCDFRFKTGGAMRMEWQPSFLQKAENP